VRGLLARNLKMMGGQVISHATVTGNMHAAGGRVVSRSGARVGGNASLGGNRVRVDAVVAENLRAVGRHITISGEVEGNVSLQGLNVRILPSARINGNLTYQSPSQAEIAPEARISGDVTFIQSERPEAMMGQAFAAAGAIWLSVVAGLILLGIVLLLVSPKLPFEAVAQICRRPWASAGLGLAVLLGGPIGMLILVVTGIGLPLAIVMAGLYIVALALGLLDFAILVGWTCARRIGKGEGAPLLWRIVVLAGGLVALSMIALVPGFGALMLIIVFVMGTGAVLLQGMAMRGALQTL
jgi:cytoskeletal protein CcmA (bactofilin family)